MRHKFALLFCFLFVSSLAHARQEMVFKVEYQPGKTYTSEINSLNYIEMNFSGDEETMQKIKSSGMKLPLVLEQNQSMWITTRTGSRDGSSRIPLVLTYDKVSMEQKMNGQAMGDGAKSPLENTKIEGWAGDMGMIKIDSIYGDLPPAMKQSLRQIIQNLQEQVKFPEKPMKINDQFTMSVPMTIPLAGMQAVKIVVKMVYTLKSIEASAALFDITQDVTMDFSIDQGNARATGSGNGKVTFDLATKFITALETNTDMNLVMQMEKLEISAKMNSKSSQAVTIR